MMKLKSLAEPGKALEREANNVELKINESKTKYMIAAVRDFWRQNF
jgi:hypothetical protein